MSKSEQWDSLPSFEKIKRKKKEYDGSKKKKKKNRVPNEKLQFLYKEEKE